MKTILVPLDGSELSEGAVPYAAALAYPVGARLVLLRGVPHGSWSRTARNRSREELQEARNELAAVARELQDQGMRVEWNVVEDEGAWSILTAAETFHADLIVMATHGRTGVRRWVFGSVADRVLRFAPTPVLLVPPTARFQWDDAQRFRIFVTLDGSTLGEEAIPPAAQLAEITHAEVTLVRAVEPFSTVLFAAPEANVHYDPFAEMRTARAYLEGLVGHFQPGTRVTAQVTEGAPAKVILGEAKQGGAHVIALATHGRSGLARTALGSVAEAVLRGTQVPLLVVRPAAAARRTDTPAAPPTVRTPLAESSALPTLSQ